MGNANSVHPNIPPQTIQCLDLYDQRLKAEAAVQLKVVGVCKDLVGIINEYVCCPREMLISVSGGYTADEILYDLSVNTRLVKLLPDFIECFHSINAIDSHDPSIRHAKERAARKGETWPVPPVSLLSLACYCCF